MLLVQLSSCPDSVQAGRPHMNLRTSCLAAHMCRRAWGPDCNLGEFSQNATWYMTGLYLGKGIGLLSACAASSQVSLAINTSLRASSGVSPKAEQYFRSGISAKIGRAH